MQQADDVSIVIPTLNRTEHLQGCLDAIDAQTVRPAEVIIVVHVADQKTIDFLQQHAGKYSFPIRGVLTSFKGFSPTAGTGLLAARTPYVGSIDDDVIIPPHWVSSVRTLFAHASPSVGILAGLGPRPSTTAVLRGSPATFSWYGRFVTNFEALPRDAMLPMEAETFLEGNVAYRKDVISADLFDPAGTGGRLTCYSLDISLAVRRRGWTILLAPELTAIHHSVRGILPEPRPYESSSYAHVMSHIIRKHRGRAWLLPYAMYALCIGQRETPGIARSTIKHSSIQWGHIKAMARTLFLIFWSPVNRCRVCGYPFPPRPLDVRTS